MGMLFADNKSDADVLREAGYRSTDLAHRIDELNAAIQTLKRDDSRAMLHVSIGATNVYLGLLAETARQFFVAALEEARTRKAEIDAKLAQARKALEE
jgi:hypothetical protein